MELACDILKRNVSNPHNNMGIIKREIKQLQKKLINKKTLDSFLESIKKMDYIQPVTKFVKELFDIKSSKDMTDAILMAYCISLFSDRMFDSYKSRFEQKLILSANKVVLILEKFVSDKTELTPDFYKDFYIVLDHYFSLYNIWKSEDYLKQLNYLFEQVQEQSRIINIQIKRNMKPGINKSKGLIDELFRTGPKYATRILLHNYDIISVSDELEKYLWAKIKQNYYHHYDEMFLIIVAELRIKLIPLLSNPHDRKNIYYSIDTEEILQTMIKSDFSNTKISEIINIFGAEITKINKNLDFQNVSVDQLKRNKMLLLDIFELFYGSVNAVKNT